MANMSQKSLQLFLDYARDARNWPSQIPRLGGNVAMTKGGQGNISQLKRAGLIMSFRDDGYSYIFFTDEGIALAAKHGIKIKE
jgi:hypothetical protein